MEIDQNFNAASQNGMDALDAAVTSVSGTSPYGAQAESNGQYAPGNPDGLFDAAASVSGAYAANSAPYGAQAESDGQYAPAQTDGYSGYGGNALAPAKQPAPGEQTGLIETEKAEPRPVYPPRPKQVGASFAPPEKPGKGGKTGKAKKAKKKGKPFFTKKKIIGLIILLLVIAGGVGFYFYQQYKAKNTPLNVETETLEKQDLQNKVSSTGKLESTEVTNVYSNLNYKVLDVKVELGDTVKAGDVLCVLDVDDLQKDIKSKEASLSLTEASSNQKLKESQKKLSDAKGTLAEDLNATLMNARNSVETARVALEDAKKKYDDSYYLLGSGENTGLNTAEANVLTAKIGLENAQRAYDDAVNALNSGTDSTMMTAENGIKSAEISVSNAQISYQSALNSLASAQRKAQEAQDAYNKANASLSTGTNLDSLRSAVTAANEAVITAQLGVATAQNSLNSASNTLANAQKSYTAGVNNSNTSLEKLKNSLTTAQSTYDNAVKAYESALTGNETDFEALELAVEKAQTSYDNAQQALEATKRSIELEIQGYEENLKSTQISADTTVSQLELQKLLDQLDDANVIAPVSGTITKVNATEGTAPSGILFVISDTESLKIKTDVSEYDVAKVAVDQKVEIKTDATGETVFDGRISKIAPAATSAASTSSSSTTSTQVKFETEVEVLSGDPLLRIGMNARLNIITEEQNGVLAVTFEALTQNTDGEDILYIADPQPDGTYIAKEVKVTTGMETDFYAVVSGDGIKEGVIVITDASMVTPGAKVMPSGMLGDTIMVGGPGGPMGGPGGPR